MADRSKIEWTDATVNAINGCSVVSPACTNCYAMKLAGTRLRNHPSREGLTQPSKAGPVWTGEVRLWEPALLQPLRWTRPRRIFWNAHGDMFHPAVPDEWIDRCFAVMALTPQHVHQVLTKRPERMRAYFSQGLLKSRIAALIYKMDKTFVFPGFRLPLPNVWLGTTAEDQERWNERVPHLRGTPAAARFVSAEPLLGPIVDDDGLGGIDQVIVGGESGPGARAMHPDWARGLRDQCAAAGVPFFFKQWGEWLPVSSSHVPEHFGAVCDQFHVTCSNGFVGPLSIESIFLHNPDRRPGCFPNGRGGDSSCSVVTVKRVGKRAAGRLLDGVQHDGMPA